MSATKFPTYLYLPDICRLFNISPRTAYRWRQLSTGPRSQKLAGKLVWERADVIDWLATNQKRTGRGGI